MSSAKKEDAALLDLTDTVVLGRDSGDSEVYLLAETSITIYPDDVSGAKDRADLLAYATGARTQALVIGETIGAEAQALADARGVAVSQFIRKRRHDPGTEVFGDGAEATAPAAPQEQ